MISKMKQAALLVASGVALASCTLGEAAKTDAPAKKAAAADYQAPVAQTPAASKGLQAICYNDADLGIVRARMLQQELVVATLQCQTPNGVRAFDSLYNSFVNKFSADLSANGRSLTELSRRKRFNVDVMVTEFSNRMAQRAPVDKEFCSRSQRALEWSLDAKVTSMVQAPPPYDLGPEMNIYPCPAK